MPPRTQAAKRPAAGRFSRPGAAGAGAAARPAGRRPATPSRRPIVARRKPQKTGMAKAMESLGGALPGGKGSKGRSSGGGKTKGMGAGLALLAGAAGLAVKNRGRIQGMLGGKDKDRTAHADAPAQPIVKVEPGGGPAGSHPGVTPGATPTTPATSTDSAPVTPPLDTPPSLDPPPSPGT
jgi:hypothetical protein